VNSPIVPDITGSTSICVNSTSLLKNSANNGTWKSDSTKYATIDPVTGLVYGKAAGTSLITYSVTLNGCTTEKTTTVTIKPLPVVDGITGPTNVCVGENISLTNTTKLGQWSSSDNSIATVNGAGVVTGVKGGAVTINYTVTSDGCSNASSSPIAVNNLPTVAPISGTTTFCSGLTSKLSCTTPNGSWSSGNTSVVTMDNNGVAFGVTQGASSIAYTVIENGCTSKSLVNVLINQTPEVAEITGDPSVCIGSTMNLQCVTQGGTWASESTGVATIDQTGLIKSVSPGTSVISYTKIVGACTNKKTDTITVYAMPVVAKTSGKFDICAGLSTTLKNDTVGGIWSSSKPQIASINGFGVLKGETAGSAKIYYTVTKNGCTTMDSVTVNVTGALQVSAITGNTTICENATTDLKNTTPNGTWSSSSDAIATINSNTGVVTGITSGQATITYSVVTNGVCPQLSQTTVIVNQVPTVNNISDITVCEGGKVNEIVFTGNSTPTYQWQIKNNNTSIGLSSSGTGNIPEFTGTGTVKGGISQTALIQVTPNLNGCTGAPKSFLITVKAEENPAFSYPSNSYCKKDADPVPLFTPTTTIGGYFTASPAGLSLDSTSGIVALNTSKDGYYSIKYTTSKSGKCVQDSTLFLSISNNPSVFKSVDQTVCDGVDFNAINFAGNQGSMFSWSNTNASIGIALNGLGNISQFKGAAKKEIGSSNIGTIVVTPYSGSCLGVKDTFLLTVKAKDSANFTYPSNSFCKTLDDNPQAIIIGKKGGVFTASPSGLTLNPSTGLITLVSSKPGLYTIKYTTINGCTNSDSMQITIGDNPAVDDILSQNKCIGSTFGPINFTGSPGTTFDWVNNTPAIGLATSGNGNIPAFTGIGVSASKPTLIATITVTPHIGSCPGSKKSVTLTLNYSDDVEIAYSDNSYCAKDANPKPTIISGPTNGVFSATPIGLSLNSSDGTINITGSKEGYYQVMYRTTGVCADTAIVPIGISFNPSVDLVLNQTVCTGVAFTSKKFTGSPGSIFEWKNSNTAIGLAAQGDKDIESFVSKNTTKDSITGTVTVIPRAGSCTGNPMSFDLKVNPVDDATFNYDASSYCATAVDVSPTISGTKLGTFSSSPANGIILDPVSGKIGVAASNAGSYTITYITKGVCPKVTSQLIKINPVPIVNPVGNQTVCQDNTFDAINFTGTTSTIFNWTNTDTLIGLTSNGIGGIAPFKAIGTNKGGFPRPALLKVTPYIESCAGTPLEIILTVNSIDNPNFTYSDNSFCTSQGNPNPTFKGTTGGYFTASPAGIDIDPVSGVINLANSTSNTYKITYTTKGSCKADTTVSIGIGSGPIVDSIIGQTICAEESFSKIAFSGNSAAVYDWTNTNTAIGLSASGSGNIEKFKAIGTVPGGPDTTSLITVTPRIGTCIGKSRSFALKVNTLDDASFSYSNNSFCKTENNPSPNITGMKDGKFTFTPVGLAMNSNGDINLGNSTSGSYTISYTVNKRCPNVATFPISIGNSPTVTSILDQTVCVGSPFDTIRFTGSIGAQFSWTNDNPLIGLLATGSGDINPFTSLSAVKSSITVTPFVGQCVGSSKTFNLTANPLVPTTISYPNSSYCLNPPGQAKPIPTITGPSGGSYSVFPSGLSLDVSNGSVDLDKSISGNYTVTYALNGVACATNATTKIAIGENPSVNDITSQTVCKDIRFNEIVFSGTNGTQFSWVNSNPSIGLSLNGAGNIPAFYGINGTKNKVTSVITVTPSVGTCIGTSKSFTLNINPSDDASFSYTANKFCADESNPAPSSITNKGGVFSASKVGIELDKDNGVIDLNKSIPGLYNITYLTKGNCPDVYTEAITLVPKPSINPILDTTVCNGTNFNTIVFKGSANTQFDWVNDKESIGLPKTGVSDITSFKAKGTIPGGSPITAKIVVTPKIDGCSGKPISFELHVNASDAPYFSYDKYSICQTDLNPKANLNGTKNGVFSALPSGLSINNTSGEIAIAASLVNTYSVTYTTKGTCPKDSTRSIIINPTPIVNGLVDQQKCQDASFDTIFFKGTANTTFNWENSKIAIGLSANGSGNIPAFKAKGTVYGSGPLIGTITVTPTINGCFGSNKSLTLTVNPLDNPAFAYDDNSFCNIQADPIPLIKGTLGGYFTFTPKGLVMDTASGKINLAATTANNYLITYHTVGICKQDSTVGIGIGSKPSLEDIDDQDMCEGASFDPVVFKGNPGTVFSWTNSNATVGIPTKGITNIPAYIASGVVNFRDTIAQMVVTSRIGKCPGKDTVNFKYKVRAKPNVKGRIVQAPSTSIFLKDTSVCKGTNIKLIAIGINTAANYRWTPITGLLGFPTSGPSVTTNLDSTQQFVVSGINQFGCSNSDSVMVRVFNPKISNLLKDTTVCAGSSFNAVKFTGNTPSPTFTWTNSNPAIGLSGSGIGNIPSFVGINNTTNSNETGIITVVPKYTIQNSGVVCIGAKSTVKLNVNKLDNPSFTGYLSQYCSNETASTVPFITGTKNGVFTASPFGLVVNPNTGQLFPTASMAKSYYVKYTTKGVCTKADSMSLTIKPILTASIKGDKTVCRDAIQPVVTFKGANGKAPYTFKYSINGGAVKEIKSKVATDSVTITVPTDIAGTFVYALLSIEESSASNCNNPVSGSVAINVNTLPIAQISGNATVCEGVNPPNITLAGVNGTSPFTFMYAINGVTQPAVSTKNGDYSVNVPQPTTKNATYTYSLIGIQDGSNLGCYQPQNNSITVTVKKLPTASIVASAKSICIDGTSPIITFTGANGIKPYTFEYKLNGVSNYITSNNGSSAVMDVPSNTPNKYIYELVSVKDGGQYSCSNIAVTGKDSVEVIPGAFVDQIEDRTVCKDNNSGVINFTGSTNSTFSWYTNNTTSGLISSGKDSIPNFKGLNTSSNTPNISVITVTPAKGVCKGKSMTFKMLIRPNPIPKTSPIKIICPGDSLLIKGITPTGVSPDYQFFWTPNATLGCLDCSQVWAKPTKTTEYTFIAKDAFGCIGKDKFTMLVRDTPLIQANDTTLCGETKEITLKGTGGVTYSWSNGIMNGQPFTPNFGVNKYGLTGKDKYGCVYTDTVVVSVLTQPKASFTLSTNEVYAAPTQPASILITNTSVNGNKYVFNYGNGDSIVEATTLEPKTAIYQYPGVATVGLVVYNGACSDAASLPIIIKKIDTTSIVKLPNVFTPNGDGENDEFMIFVKNPKTVRLTIFNRWGNPVFEITETAPSWDGKINGYLASEGVYFYEYIIETQSGAPMKGNGYVQLIRK
jgi:gliding motility-associated-like protein